MYDKSGGIACSVDFEKFAGAYGGTYLRDPDTPNLDQIVEFAERRLQEVHAVNIAGSATLPRFEGHILASRLMNAVVGQAGDAYAYGLFGGMIADYYASAKTLGQGDDASLLFEFAIDFTVAHEINHVTHGHVGLGEAEFGVAARDELGASGFSLLDERTMEMDTDCAAVAFIFMNASGANLVKARGTEAPTLTFSENPPLPLLAAVELVGKTLAVCFDQMERGEEKLKREPDNRTHPVTITRLFYCQALLASLLSLAPALTEEMQRSAATTLVDATKTALDLLGDTGGLAGGAAEREAFALAQYESLRDNWVQLQPKLAPHAFVELAPAQPYEPAPPF